VVLANNYQASDSGDHKKNFALGAEFKMIIYMWEAEMLAAGHHSP
jgi:hypothetical protein